MRRSYEQFTLDYGMRRSYEQLALGYMPAPPHLAGSCRIGPRSTATGCAVEPGSPSCLWCFVERWHAADVHVCHVIETSLRSELGVLPSRRPIRTHHTRGVRLIHRDVPGTEAPGRKQLPLSSPHLPRRSPCPPADWERRSAAAAEAAGPPAPVPLGIRALAPSCRRRCRAAAVLLASCAARPTALSAAREASGAAETEWRRHTRRQELV